jgi:hypothetical protein
VQIDTVHPCDDADIEDVSVTRALK